MTTRGLPYIKTFVREFDRRIRVYLNDQEGSHSFISTNLVCNIDPSVIEVDSNGEYVTLDLIYRTYEGEEYTKTVTFDVVDTAGHEFVLADDVLQNYHYGNHGIFFEGGEVKIYQRG